MIARNSVFSYKDKSVKVQQVAEDLGARYVLEGSVRKGGNRVRITAQLIDAKTGHHLWTEKFDRELADIFEVQDEITQRISSAFASFKSGVSKPSVNQLNTGASKTRSPCVPDRSACDCLSRFGAPN